MSLLSIFGKRIERLIAVEVSSFLDENQFLNNRRLGSRRGRSTRDLMLHLSSEWQKPLKKGETTSVFAIYFWREFDHVWNKGLAARLQSIGFKRDLLHVTIDNLYERTLSVLINGKCSSERLIRTSAP